MRFIFTFCTLFLFLLLPFMAYAEEQDFGFNENQEIVVSKQIETTTKMTQGEIEDLFGPEPYLGPTSWIGSKQDETER